MVVAPPLHLSRSALEQLPPSVMVNIVAWLQDPLPFLLSCHSAAALRADAQAVLGPWILNFCGPLRALAVLPSCRAFRSLPEKSQVLLVSRLLLGGASLWGCSRGCSSSRSQQEQQKLASALALGLRHSSSAPQHPPSGLAPSLSPTSSASNSTPSGPACEPPCGCSTPMQQHQELAVYAAQEGRLLLLHLLLTTGALELQARQHSRPFFASVLHNQPGALGMLLQHGAPATHLDGLALAYATHHGYTQVTALLLAALPSAARVGAHLHLHRPSLLHAITHGLPEAVQMMLDLGSSSGSSGGPPGWHPRSRELESAVGTGALPMLRLLLRYSCEDMGGQALSHAVLAGNTPAVMQLLQAVTYTNAELGQAARMAVSRYWFQASTRAGLRVWA